MIFFFLKFLNVKGLIPLEMHVFKNPTRYPVLDKHKRAYENHRIYDQECRASQYLKAAHAASFTKELAPDARQSTSAPRGR